MKEFDLPVGWKYVSLADIANVINGVSFKPNDIKKEGIRILRSGNIQSGYLVLKDDDVFLDNTYYNRDNTLQYLDNCITASTGSIDVLGKCGTVFEETHNCQIGAFMRLVRSKSKDDALYISFILHSPLYYQYIRRLSKNGTSINNINNSHLEEFKFPLPPKNVKEKISKWYYSLEKKIALNTRMNAELEAMAKQLYDYWFVQFDFPDENGKPYKSSGGKMVYNPTLKREIPAGWDNCEIKDLSEVVNGATPLTTNLDYYGNDIIWITPNDLSNQKAKFISCGERSLTQIGYDSCSTTLMPAGSVLMSSRAPIGLMAIAEVDLCTNQGFKNFVPYDMMDNYYLYYYVKEHMAQIEQLGAGTTFREVSRDTIIKFPILKISDRELYSKWYEQIDSICKEQKNLLLQIRNLTHLRDSLLPMLMNGQVTVE